MTHPFQGLSPKAARSVFIPLLVTTLLVMALLNMVSAPLTTPAAPSGIISYELAGTLEKAQSILDSWDSLTQLHAAFALGFDYVFMLAYSTTIGLGCVMAAGVLRSRGWPLAGIGAWLAWGQWLAAGFDAVENIALIAMLFAGVASPWPQVAYWCAVFKFGLIFLGLVYAFYGGVVRLFIRMQLSES
jgi:hypothetical protein